MSGNKLQAMSMAIEVITAWTDAQNDTTFATQRAALHLAAGEAEALSLTAGLISLAGVLLQNLANERGNGTPEGERAILQEIAARVAGQQ